MGKYDDIIHLPHHVSDHRAPMSMLDRAAQFSPFAALTGYDAVIAETGRLTDTKSSWTRAEKRCWMKSCRSFGSIWRSSRK